MKFSLRALFVLITVCAVLFAFRDRLPAIDPALSIILIFAIVGIIVAWGVWLVAKWVAPPCYRSGTLWLFRSILGNRITALALNQYGWRLINANEAKAAIGVFSTALQLDATEAYYWAGRGMAKYQNGDSESAIADLTRAIRIDPDVKNAFLYRGYAYVTEQRFEEARDDLTECLHRDASAAEVYFWRAHVNEVLGHWHDAAADYRRACDLAPSMVRALVAAARLQAACPVDGLRNGAAAVKNAERACVMSYWKDWIPITVLAAAHAEAGDFLSALKYAQQAFDLAPESEQDERAARIRLYASGEPFRLPEV